MPSELDVVVMVSKDDSTSGDSQEETEITLLYNNRQEENNVCSQNTENEETTIRNDNYAYNNVNETRNLDNTMLSSNQENVLLENSSVECETRPVESERIMENDMHNNSSQVTRLEPDEQNSIEEEAADSLHSLETIDNTTQTSSEDTQSKNSMHPSKNEHSKKTFTRFLENNVNKSTNQENVENASENCENEIENLRIEENHPTNNMNQMTNGTDALISLDSPDTIDNTTQTSLQDTQSDNLLQSLKNEPSKKNFTRYTENNVNNSDSSQSTSGCNSLYGTSQLDDNNAEEDQSCDVSDGAACLPLQIPVINSTSGEGSTCDNDILMVNCSKPFKLPSLVNLYEAAEAQRAELEDQDALNAMSSADHESEMFAGSESSNSDPESHQASNICRNKKVCAQNKYY